MRKYRICMVNTYCESEGNEYRIVYYTLFLFDINKILLRELYRSH